MIAMATSPVSRGEPKTDRPLCIQDHGQGGSGGAGCGIRQKEAETSLEKHLVLLSEFLSFFPSELDNSIFFPWCKIWRTHRRTQEERCPGTGALVPRAGTW